MQNFDASAASQGQQWFQDSRRLMQDWSANAASQMMPGAPAPQTIAGAPITFGGYRAKGGQLIPRTNFLTWLPHIYRIDQDDQPRNGLYETTVYEAQPPVMPKAHELNG